MSIKLSFALLGFCAVTMSCRTSSEGSDLEAAAPVPAQEVTLVEELKYFEVEMKQILQAPDGVCSPNNPNKPSSPGANQACSQLATYDFNSDTRAEKIPQFVVPTHIDPFDPNRNDAPLAVLRGVVNNRSVNTAFVSGMRYAAVVANAPARIYVATGRSGVYARVKIYEKGRADCGTEKVYFLPKDLDVNMGCRVVNSSTECRFGISCEPPK